MIGTPLENHNAIGSLRNTGPEPLENHKAAHSMLGHHRHASETPFKLLFAGEQMMVHLLAHLSRRLIGELIVFL